MTGEKRTETRCTLEHDVIMGVPICNQTCTLLKNNPHMVKNLWGQIFGLDIGMTACIVYDCREGRGEIYRECTECYSIYVANSKHVACRFTEIL